MKKNILLNFIICLIMNSCCNNNSTIIKAIVINKVTRKSIYNYKIEMDYSENLKGGMMDCRVFSEKEYLYSDSNGKINSTFDVSTSIKNITILDSNKNILFNSEILTKLDTLYINP